MDGQTDGLMWGVGLGWLGMLVWDVGFLCWGWMDDDGVEGQGKTGAGREGARSICGSEVG